MFYVTAGKGFRVQFVNGWALSVQFGPGNYCGNSERHDFAAELAYAKGERAEASSPDAEIAIIHEETGEFLRLGCDTVAGYVSAEIVALIMAILARPTMPTEETFNEIRALLA